MACTLCPFAFTEASEKAQNYGCLPSPYDIVQMKKKSGHNWGCHSNEERICKGFVDYVEEFKVYPHNKDIQGLDLSQGKLISYDVWVQEGEEAALKKVK